MKHDFVRPWGQRQECVGSVRLSFIVSSIFSESRKRMAGEELSLFTANLNVKVVPERLVHSVRLTNKLIVVSIICVLLGVVKLRRPCVFRPTLGRTTLLWDIRVRFSSINAFNHNDEDDTSHEQEGSDRHSQVIWEQQP